MLFDAFNAYITTSKFKYEINIVKFGVRLTNLKLKGKETVKARDYNSKKFNVPILKTHFGIGSSQVKLILSPKPRAKPMTSARKTGSSMPPCVARWVWLLRVLRSGGE